MKKVFVFELNSYHTETFPIYENLLPSLLHDDIQVEYFVTEERYEDTLATFKNVHLLCPRWLSPFIRHLQLRVPYFRRRINALVTEQKPDMVVFNSIEPERNYKVFKKINAPKKLGLVHNPKKSGIVRGENECYFVLSRLLYENFKDKLPLDGYLLPYFRQFVFPPKKEDARVLVAVQGIISFKRREYAFLIEAAKVMREQGVANVIFNIIGSKTHKDGPEFFKMVQDAGLSDYFLFYDKLDDREFFEQIDASDCIMTLLHEKQQKYYHEKTTASLSHAAAYGKPLLLYRENAKAWDMTDVTALIYDDAQTCIRVLSDKASIQAVTTHHIEVTDTIINENIARLKELGC